MIKYIIFDLDGTLIDTVDDLGRACDYLLEKAGLKKRWSRENYKSFVGNGAKLLVSRAFGGSLSEKELERQYLLFKKKYNEIKLENAYAYSGVKELLQKLKTAGLGLAVCTNKPENAARDMIAAVFGKGIFDFVCGAGDSGPVKPDVSVLSAQLDSLGISPGECLWVGDSCVDIASAKNLGCGVIAVSWGFVSRDALFSASPAYMADSPGEVYKIISSFLQ
ncbi:MAG: HAD-IA family hydrolase [Clostridiales bacterium]|nr:HAD-IA family hydrolase [Clostridiales bacterium]